MYCARCGTPIHVGQRFCAACGAPLVLPRVQAPGARRQATEAALAPLSDAALPEQATGDWRQVTEAGPCSQPSATSAQRSYQRAIAITLGLYACGYLPGAIANTVYWWAARRDEASTGACPPGGAAIASLFALGVGVPLGGTLAILALRLLGLLFSSTTWG
jgi:hypothetical protein